MLRFAADENFNEHIVRGVLRRNPEIDVARIQDVGLSGADDSTVLEWAAQEGRVFLTHDVATVGRHAESRIRSRLPMPGVFYVGQKLSTRAAIDDIVLLAECSVEGEWEGQIRFLPLC
jgi:hypothetical protein